MVFPAVAIPCPPVAAFIVGFGLYYALAKAGMESEVLEMAPAGAAAAPAPEAPPAEAEEGEDA